MCEDPNDSVFEFCFTKAQQPQAPQCDGCVTAIDLGVPESYHKEYWMTYGRDLYTHIACF